MAYQTDLSKYTNWAELTAALNAASPLVTHDYMGSGGEADGMPFTLSDPRFYNGQSFQTSNSGTDSSNPNPNAVRFWDPKNGMVTDARSNADGSFTQSEYDPKKESGTWFDKLLDVGGHVGQGITDNAPAIAAVTAAIFAPELLAAVGGEGGAAAASVGAGAIGEGSAGYVSLADQLGAGAIGAGGGGAEAGAGAFSTSLGSGDSVGSLASQGLGGAETYNPVLAGGINEASTGIPAYLRQAADAIPGRAQNYAINKGATSLLQAGLGSALGGVGGKGGNMAGYQPQNTGAADAGWLNAFNQVGDLNTLSANAQLPGYAKSLQNANNINYQPYLDSANQAGQQYQALSRQSEAQGQQFGQVGQQIYQNAFDPQNALRAREEQGLTDQVRAGQAARGLGNSAVGAAEENQAMGNFDINWQNNQLQRQTTGLAGLTSSLGSQTQAGQQGAQFQQQAGSVPLQAQQFAGQQPGAAAQAYGQGISGLAGQFGNQAGLATPYLNQGVGASQWNTNFGAQQNAAQANLLTQGIGGAINQYNQPGSFLNKLFSGGGGGGGGSGLTGGGAQSLASQGVAGWGSGAEDAGSSYNDWSWLQ